MQFDGVTQEPTVMGGKAYRRADERDVVLARA